MSRILLAETPMKTHGNAEALAAAIAAIGTDRFGPSFFDLARRQIGAGRCTAFATAGVRDAAILVAEGASSATAAVVKRLSVEYATGAYRRDPVLKISEARRAVPHCIVQIDPDTIDDPGYRDRFYSYPGIRHELALVTRSGEQLLCVSFYRAAGQRAFGDAEHREVEALAPVALSLLLRHFELCGSELFPQPAVVASPADRQAAVLDRVRDAMLADCARLTPREAEVCARILLGYTVLGTSMHLDISVNTVATHRKRAYSKLSISSQNELFARYFSTVERLRLN